jgi:hypothetical protein
MLDPCPPVVAHPAMAGLCPGCLRFGGWYADGSDTRGHDENVQNEDARGAIELNDC